MATGKRLTGINPLAYLGVEPTSPPQVVVNTFPPTPADVQNNNIGTIWIQLGTAVYILVALVGNTATWVQIFPSVATALEIDTDAGIANALAGVINLFGGSNINTSAAGNTVTVNLNNDISVHNLAASGTVTFTGFVTTGVLQADLFGNVTPSIGTDGQVLIAATVGGEAVWNNITSLDGSITIINGANTIDLSIPGGGMAITTLDADVGSATGATVTIAGGTLINTTAAASTLTVNLNDSGTLDGQVIIAQTGGSAAWATLTPGPGVTIVDGPNSITISASVPGFTATATTVGAVTQPIITLPVADSQMVTITAVINGLQSTFANAYGANIIFTVFRPTGGDVTIVGAPIINANTTSTADISGTVDIIGENAIINVIGVALQTWNWTASYESLYS